MCGGMGWGWRREREFRAQTPPGPPVSQGRYGPGPSSSLLQMSSDQLLSQVLPSASNLRSLRDNHLGGAEVFKRQQDQSLLISQ